MSLAAGTYNLSAGINFGGTSNVTLRGAGADQTFLVFSAGSSCQGPNVDVCIAGDNNWNGGPLHTANWTAGYAIGTTTITLDSTTGLTVGNFIILDQLDDTSDSGGIYICQTQGVCSLEGPSGSGRSGRQQEQIVQVTGISGSNVTISPGLYMPNWSAAKSPGAWWGNTIIKGAGLENLSIDNSNSNAQSNIRLQNAENCWVRGVRSLNGDRNHVWMFIASHNTIESNYFYGTLNAASQSYGVEGYMSSDNLVQNNILQHIVAGLMENGSNSGDVEAYNFSFDDHYSVATWMMGQFWAHAGAIDHILLEGDEGPSAETDPIHGTHHFLTFFRNYWIGWETGKTQQTNAIYVYTFGRFYNVVGNVLGKVGYHNNYQTTPPSGTSANTSVYNIGWSGNQGTTSSSLPNDPIAVSSMLRWGNYDVVNGAVRWNSTEVPTSDPNFPNSVPGNHLLPTSMYLSSQPAWWTMQSGFGTTPPFPAIGPDVTGGTGPGGFAYEIPAELCFDHMTGGPPLTFNAAACYVNP